MGRHSDLQSLGGETDASEFEVQWTEFKRSDRNEQRWIPIEAKRRVFESFSNKAEAVECAKFIQRGYCQEEQADLVARQELDREWEQRRLVAREEVERERDQVNIWQDNLGKWHWYSPYYEVSSSRGILSQSQAMAHAQRFLAEQRGEIEIEHEAPSMKFLTLFDLSRAAQEWELAEQTRLQTPECTVDEHETSRLETFAKGLGQDVFHRAAKVGRGHLAKQSESLHERARAERTDEKECGSELER